MIETFLQNLPHGITLSCRATGQRGRPVLMFLHGFPEGAFVWDPLLEYFAQPKHGAYRCIAPNLRGFECSSAPVDVAAYRPGELVRDIVALIETQAQRPDSDASTAPLACLIAHDWGGAVAWKLANRHPELARSLVIVNSPHPGTFLRELKANPQQQAASAYMNFLIRPDAEQLLAQDDFRRMWRFLTEGSLGRPGWLTADVMAQYRGIWRQGLKGGCNYYRASPLLPARAGDPGGTALEIAFDRLTVGLPTLVLWGLNDLALLPGLTEGLEAYIPRLTLDKVADASHWIVHEQPQRVIASIEGFLGQQAGEGDQ